MTDIVERLRDTVQILATTQMNLSMEAWDRVSNAVLEAADTITALRAEVERLKVENEAVLSANRDVMLHWDVLKADYEKLRAALMAELADHEEAIAHDRGGLEYASLVGIPISNADSLAQSVRYHESRAKLIRAALEEKQ